MDKLRVAGETIEEGKIYTGKRVIELLNTSFTRCLSCQYRHTEAEMKHIYDQGYAAGYAQASTDVQELRNVLHKLIKEED